jgi:hypothetical protein
MDGGPCEEGKAFVVVPRFVLDEMFGLMAIFFLMFFFGWGCVWVAPWVEYMAFLIHLYLCHYNFFYSLGPCCGFLFCMLKNLFLM